MDEQMDMRALVVTANGGPEVLEVQQRPVPEPEPGQVVVEVAASGVNFLDVYQRQGVYPIPRGVPFVLGMESAGRVTAVGDGVDGFGVGDVVASADAPGSMAQYVAVAADAVVPVPDGIAAELAAAAMLQGMTAHYLVTSTYDLQRDSEVLVHAAAGGVGQLLVQLAVARGAHVVATVGSAAKVDIVRDLGAHEIIRYDEIDDAEQLAAAVRDASDGGVHVAYDSVGRSTFDASLASLRRRGMLVLYGAASGAVPPVDPQQLNKAGSVFLTRPKLQDHTVTTDELRWRAGDILAAIADGTLHLEVGGRYRLEDAAQAYRDLEGRATTGKLLVLPQAS